MITIPRPGVAAIIYQRTSGGIRFLIIRHITGKKTFVSGGIKRGEEKRTCLFRELNEEIGLKESDVRSVIDTGVTVDFLVNWLIAKIDFIYALYLVEVSPEFIPRTSFEVQKFWWMSYDEVMKTVAPSLRPHFSSICRNNNLVDVSHE